MSDRWAVRQRQQWIAQMLHVYGFINREHIMKMFEVSMPQASIDLQQFMKANPDAMSYNTCLSASHTQTLRPTRC